MSQSYSLHSAYRLDSSVSEIELFIIHFWPPSQRRRSSHLELERLLQIPRQIQSQPVCRGLGRRSPSFANPGGQERSETDLERAPGNVSSCKLSLSHSRLIILQIVRKIDLRPHDKTETQGRFRDKYLLRHRQDNH